MSRPLLVMLHGAYFGVDDFAEHGFVAGLHCHAPGVEPVAGGLAEAEYLEPDLAARLHARVVAPALAAGPRRLWLLGISLGGMGALRYAQAGLAEIDGIILLAPFLATRGTIAEVTAAGGLEAWRPGPPPEGDIERQLVAWIASADFRARVAPRLHLGYGAQDRFAPASRLLASSLPPARVTVTEGQHDWPT
jgi:alpha-beta hydrolase superfamily lysophospholipase